MRVTKRWAGTLVPRLAETMDVTGGRGPAGTWDAKGWGRQWSGAVDGIRDWGGDEWGDVSDEEDRQRRARGKVRWRGA